MQACRYAPSLIYDSSEDITGFPHGDAYLGKIISVHLTWFRPSHLRYLDEWIVPSRSALPRVRCLIVTVHDENWASESSQWTETRPLGAPILAGRALLLPPTGVVPNTFTTTAKRRRHLILGIKNWQLLFFVFPVSRGTYLPSQRDCMS